jgi:hypothetical protein
VQRLPHRPSSEPDEDDSRDLAHGGDVHKTQEALATDHGDGSDEPQRQQRAGPHRQRGMVLGRQIGREDLGQVAPFGQEDDTKAVRIAPCRVRSRSTNTALSSVPSLQA